MALTYTSELDAVTNDYFMLEDGKAVDIYFNTSFLLNYLMKQQKGIWERPSGGQKIRIPLEYDGQEAGFYVRGDTVSSDDRESVNAAYFEWKHAYGNATIYRIDELKNTGEYGEVQLIQQKVAGAQKSVTKILAGSIYNDAAGGGNELTGVMACCNETAGTKYGNIEEEDLVASDGTKPWEGKRNTTTEGVTLNVIRTMASDAKLRDGVQGKPNLVSTTETLFNVINDLLQVQQRFTDGKETVKAGFTGLYFEGKDIFADDYCPSGYAFALNTNHIGFAIHRDGYFKPAKWKVIPDSPEDRTMKIYWDGNLVVNNRKAQKAHSTLS